MSQEIELYVGMRVIATGREGTITATHAGDYYNVRYSDGTEQSYISRASIVPYDSTATDSSTLAVAKQIGGISSSLPPPAYTPGGGGGGGGVSVSGGVQMQPQQQQQQQSYQYPPSQPAQSFQPPPQYQQQQQQQQYQYPQQQQQQPHYQPQQYVVGVSSMPVVHGVAATPMSVSATPVHLHSALNNTQANNNRVPGYDHSPNLGQPFSGLFDCDGAFWMSCCCPCIVGGQVSQKLGTSSFAVVVAAYVGTCVTLIIIVAVSNVDAFWLLLWLGWTCFVYSVRTHVRRMWAIPGDSCDDFCVTCCCTACSLAQVAKHVFGYRQSDYPPCGSDGTPSWQHSHVTSNVSPPSIGFVQQTPQHV